MRSNPFNGYGVALVTPFLDNGAVDFDSLAGLIDFQIENKVDFVCALGTTAETPTMNDVELQSVFEFIIKRIDGRVPVMVGCSDNCTERLVRKLQHFSYEGADAVLSCVPAYNKPSQEGVYQHFMAVAEASPLPIVLYNIPGRTGTNMTAETTLRLVSASDKFIAIKEASGNLTQAQDIIKAAPEGFGVISGDDSLAFDMIRNGAAGVISVIGNAIPKTYGNMIHLALEGNVNDAAAINDSLKDLYPLMFREGNPCGVKALMASRKMLLNTLRLPLVPVGEKLYNQIVTCFNGIKV
ncbi:MAG: 4-hydroxy-tetrahydrodipicolinate synthase [Bacteroidaceae bacterium]|nr:4-hydroxy-tetrahydrodipicolinate synthase [Bacteroidaceae bacterium]